MDDLARTIKLIRRKEHVWYMLTAKFTRREISVDPSRISRSPLRCLAQSSAESGFLLLAAVVACALVLIALAVAAPVVARDLRRDKEIECEHRANQYVRGIRLYYRKFGHYPPSMDALLMTNNVRFLRKQYVDPLTGKCDWKIVHQPKTKTRGFFGQELTGLTPGLGSAAGMASSSGTSGGTVSTSVSSTNALNAGFGGAAIGGVNGTGSTGDSSASAFGDGSGGVVMGVSSSRTGPSILTVNQQTTYETWEFWYDPAIEKLYSTASLLGGGVGGSQSSTGFGENSASGLAGSPAPTGGMGATGGPNDGSSFGKPM